MTDTLLDTVHIVLAILDNGQPMTPREEEIYSLLLVAVRKATEAGDTVQDDDINAADPLLEIVREFIGNNPGANPGEVAHMFKMGYGRAARIMKEIGE